MQQDCILFVTQQFISWELENVCMWMSITGEVAGRFVRLHIR